MADLFLALLEMLRDHNSVKICDLVCNFLMLWALNYTVYVVYLAVAFNFGSLANHVNITKLNVHRLGCKHGFLSIQYSQLPIKNLANCIFRTNHQLFDLPITPRIW